MIDPYCVSKLGGEVCITTTVLEELDKHKNDNGEKGRNVREFARIIDRNELDNVDFFESYLEDEFGNKFQTNDDKIIYVAYLKEATLITNDILMSLKASAKGIKTQRYEPVNIICDSAYTGLVDSRNIEDYKESALRVDVEFFLEPSVYRKDPPEVIEEDRIFSMPLVIQR